jgi:phosphatidylethanolamine-binding protein (PEBP) family uncharacterized protein
MFEKAIALRLMPLFSILHEITKTGIDHRLLLLMMHFVCTYHQRIYLMRLPIIIAAFMAVSVPGAALAQDMKVALGGAGWTGGKVPSGQECKRFGGNGSTPPLKVSGLPAGTDKIIVEFDDLDFGPLSSNGGHGGISYAHKGGASANLRAVPGYTSSLPAGVMLENAARSTGEFASPGYLPPCSGGRGHRYQATVKATKGGSTLATAKVVIGTY